MSCVFSFVFMFFVNVFQVLEIIDSLNCVINQKEYASIIGSLRYVTDCTRPDIAYAVGVLGRFTSKPGNEH